MREDHARRQEQLHEHGERHHHGALRLPAVHRAVEARVHGDHIGHVRVADDGDGHRHEDDRHVQQIPRQRDGARRVGLAHHGHRLLNLRLPSLLALVRLRLGAVAQHESVTSQLKPERAHQEHDHDGRLVHGERRRDARCGEHRRDRTHDQGVAALEAAQVRVALRG